VKDVEGGSLQIMKCIFVIIVMWIVVIQTLKTKMFNNIL
jgi:hypothetical protein